MNELIKGNWNRLNLYQKGLIIGFFIPIVSLCSSAIAGNLFSSANLNYCPAGSTPMLLIFFYYPSPLLSVLVAWPFLGFTSGLILYFAGNKTFFSIMKLIIGLVPLLYGAIFLILTIIEFIHTLSLKSIPYFSMLFLPSFFFIILGYNILRIKKRI